MDFLKILAGFLFNLLGKDPKAMVGISIPLDPPKEPDTVPTIDWTDDVCHITDHFTVGDCLTLHAWNRLATDADGLTDQIKENMKTLCQIIEKVREVLGCPINVHCIFRSQEYNEKVVGAIPADVHSMGMAIDFDCNGHHTIDEIHTILEPLLESLGLRMERNTKTWVHLDIHPVKNARYFLA